jgi:hypothetical protein
MDKFWYGVGVTYILLSPIGLENNINLNQRKKKSYSKMSYWVEIFFQK